METDMTVDEVRELIGTRGYDAYGSTRVYVVYADGSRYAGQVGSIKSTYQLDDAIGEGIGRLYAVTRDGVPIRRA